MRTSHRIFSVVLILLTLAAASAQDSAPAPDVTYRRAELPRGVSVEHPLNKARMFYFATELMLLPDRKSHRNLTGLYVSTDGGETWRRRGPVQNYKALFIHPDTGRLFAVVHFTGTRKDERDGSERTFFADKALASDTDGEDWTNISGRTGHFSKLEGIFQDPDFPTRVCLRAEMLRPYVLQAVDDEYTDWEWIRAWEWPRSHKRGKQ